MGNRRIWWGIGIMAAGLCAAWPFRKTWLEDAALESSPAFTAPVMAPPASPVKVSAAPADEPTPAIASHDSPQGLQPLVRALERGTGRRSIAKVDQTTELPPLAADYASAAYPDLHSAVLEQGGSSPTTANAPVPQRAARLYRIRKHDTLEDIAERLLGSRQHAAKLLAANPEVILVPEILPVGATIVIPDLSQPAEAMVRLPQIDP